MKFYINNFIMKKSNFATLILLITNSSIQRLPSSGNLLMVDIHYFIDHQNQYGRSYLSALFWGKKEPVCLENAFSIRKFIKVFLLKLSHKNSCVNFNTFSRQNGSFIFPKSECAHK